MPYKMISHKKHLNRPVLQPKLKIGQPGDKYEREADAVADQVMMMTGTSTNKMSTDSANSPKMALNPGPPSINMKCEKCREEDLQMSTENDNSQFGGYAPGYVSKPLMLTKGFGNALNSPLQNEMSSKIGADFSNVKIHTDSKAIQMNRDLGAKAFTHGSDIYFNQGQYNPLNMDGKHLLAHELTHVVQQGNGTLSSSGSIQTEMIQCLGSKHGQHSSGSMADLVADLTSPITEGSKVRFEAFWAPPPSVTSGSKISYRWAIKNRSTGKELSSFTSQKPKTRFSYPSTGKFTVEHSFISNGGTVNTVTLDQDVVAENSNVAKQSTDLRELVNDFRQYIIASAKSTGTHGITPLFLASVIRMEIENTTPFGVLNTANYRQSEIEGVESEIDDKEAGKSFSPGDINKSVGVGQIRLSTAAQLFGDISWRDQDRTNRSAARKLIKKDFEKLSTTALRNILTTLRWPKSNIQTAAELLARLKNRSHRFPTVKRTDFGTNKNAVEIIGTEYNGGGTTTPLVDAGSNFYGRNVWTFMQEKFMQTWFPNN